MSTPEGAAPRANRGGDSCPAWCTADHGRLLITAKPEYGYTDMHFSDPVAVREPVVKTGQYPGSEPKVYVSDLAGTVSLPLSTADAGALAELLELDGNAWQLASEIRAAVGTALGGAR